MRRKQAPDELAGVGAVELQTQLLRTRASLFDPATRLPTLPAVIDDVRRMLDDSETVQVFMVRIEQEQSLEALVGWERYDAFLVGVADHLRDLIDSNSADRSILCQDNVRGDVFYVFLNERTLAARMQAQMSEVFAAAGHESERSTSLSLRVGQGSIRRRAARRAERCIYSGIAQAQLDFIQRHAALDARRRREFQQLLDAQQVTTLFQPILQMTPREVVGFEALSRGPKGTYFESAEKLFGFAERIGLLGEIEQLCLQRALENARRLPGDPILFLNLSNAGIEYLESEGGGIATLAQASGWSPLRCVIEITERTYADNPEQLRSRVAGLRRQGFRIAVDDMGTGYSSLHVVADLQPDFIKLDQVLVRDLAREPIKRNLVSAITGFAKSSASRVIAEGVEQEDEVSVLQELGVDLQQGFFFGYPEPA